jgi:hypothetical protein
MHKKMLNFLKPFLYFGLICTLLLPQPVFADSVIKTVDIVQVDSTKFPEVTLTVNLLDSARTPVTQLDSSNLILKEDDVQLPYTFVSSKRGVNVVLVMDINYAVGKTGSSGKAIMAEMRDAALAFVQTVQPADAVELVTVIGSEVDVAQTFTNDSTLLTNKINGMKYENATNTSYALAGVCQAITNLDDAYPNPAPKIIILLTPDLQQNTAGCLTTDVPTKARKGEIWVHTIMMGNEDPIGLDTMSESTGGKFIRYTSTSDVNALYTQIDLLRQQYQLTYRTKSASTSERTVSLAVSPETSSSPNDSMTFTVKPSPQAPAISGIVANEGSPIIRTAPESDSSTDDATPTQVPVKASISFVDGYERSLTGAQIEVDGVPLGDMIIADDGSLSFTWDIRGFFTAGENTARIKITVQDELGMESSAETDIPIEVNIPGASNQFCLEVQNWKVVGEYLYEPCVKYNITADKATNIGITLGASVLGIIALIVIIILLISNRKAVVKASKKMGAGVSTIASRMTQRIGAGAGPKQPRAQLEVLAGGQVGRKYDLFGKTTVGRDPEKSQMTLDNPLVSRAHCTFHLDMNAGKWTLEDLESANGTYLNSLLLPPHQPRELKNGDTLDLAPIPKGGIRFRFIILVQPMSTVTLKQGQVPDPYATQNPYATRKGTVPPQTPTAGVPTTPNVPPKPPTAGVPTIPQQPGVPTIPQQPGVPTVPRPQGTPTIPQQPGVPTVPRPQGIPTIPQQPGAPTIPQQPGVPTVPRPQGTPTIPQQPGVPTVPRPQGIPTIPQQPGAPTIPQQPGVPTVPRPQGTPTIPQQPASPTVPNYPPAPPTVPNQPAPPTIPNQPAPPTVPTPPQQQPPVGPYPTQPNQPPKPTKPDILWPPPPEQKP